jgi:hypothetical protein
VRSTALVPALAFRLSNSLRVGLAPGFLFSVARFTFDEDTALGERGVSCNGAPCGAESRAATLRYDVGSGLSPFDAKLAFTLGGGILFRRPAWDLGVTFISHPLGGVDLDARRTRVSQLGPAGTSPTSLCARSPAQPEPCMFANLRYHLPWTVIAGLTAHASPRWDVTAIARFMALSRQESIRIRVIGPADDRLAATGGPERIDLYRGLRDVWEGRVRATFQAAEWVRLSATLRGETAAVRPEDTSPALADGPKLEPALAAKIQVTPWLSVGVGYALMYVFPVDANPSHFDPAASRACTDSGQDLGTAPCQKRLAGLGRPTAAGRYQVVGHTLGLTLTSQL